MMKYHIPKGNSVLLTLDEEITLSRIIGGIIKKNCIHCLAYNICRDHVHLVIVCAYEELTRIIQMVKAVSSKLFHQLHSPREHVPLDEPIGSHRKGIKRYTPLWSQKFFRADLDVWQLATLSTIPGMLYKETHLDNTISYVIGNREKHALPKSKELDEIILSFLEDQDVAFKEEYE
jgi:REP element-mobilizing transposase RayT